MGEGRAIAEVGNSEEKNHAAKVPVRLVWDGLDAMVTGGIRCERKNARLSLRYFCQYRTITQDDRLGA